MASISSADAATVKDGAPPKNKQRRMKVAPLNVYLMVKDVFDKRRQSVEDFVFQSLDAFSTTATTQDQENNNNHGGTSPSRLYTYTTFFESLRTMSTDGILGTSYHIETNPFVPGYTNSDNAYIDNESNMAFFLSQDDPGHANAVKYAIVNICAFLANAMVEAIQFDACEEFNGMMVSGGGSSFDSTNNNNNNENGDSNGRVGILSELNGVNGRYFPMSNACGQFGRLYQDEVCIASNIDNGNGDEESNVDMSCPVDSNLEITAELHPKYNYQQGKEDVNKNNNNNNVIDQSPPPPFFCMPKQYESDYAGYWDGYNMEFVRRVAYPSLLGKVDVEGCCHWGRGALMTKGTCGLGKVNHFMGKKAYTDKRPSRYPNIDFCTFPSIICGASNALLSGVMYPELKFIVPLFDWVERVQSYSNPESKWDYMAQLKLFVDGGMGMEEGDGGDGDDSLKFIDAVSSVLTRGCDGFYCSGQTIHFMEERRRNFETLIHDIFNLQERLDGLPAPSSQPKYDFDHAMRWIHSKRSKIESNILVSKNSALNGMSYFSQEYKFEPFLSALRTTSYYGVGGERSFFLGDESESLRGFNAGLVNLAFFLANAMAESITNDSCDEINWEKTETGSQYPIANSCGMNGRDYGREICPAWQSFMTCKVDTEAEIKADVPFTAVPPFLLDARPPPFQCRPGKTPAGYWDESTQTLVDNTTSFNSYGREDIEGCCFFGRGALLTRGSCNYGKLNFHIGAQAAADNRPAIYPNIDFCTQPDAVCTDDSMEMRYVVGMFEWIDKVQDYWDSTVGYSYKDELYKFVDNGMVDDMFISQVSHIVARGCHVYPCSSTSAVDTNRFLYGLERKMNFKNIIKLVFELPIAAPADRAPWNDNSFTPPAAESQTTKRPTFRPTLNPTPYPLRDPTLSPATSLDASRPTTLVTPRPTSPQKPTGSPFELSDITQYNNGGIYIINNEASSFTDESIVVTKNTTIVLEKGGFIEAPLNTNWPAVRVSIASTFIGKGGFVNGSYADTSFLEGEYEDGGEGIHVNNGQSSPETASYAEFYDDIYVIGGDAPNGVGGNALHVNGFGTQAYIYGGHFIGGSGTKDNGLSLYVFNSGRAHIRAGLFTGDMKVERSGSVAFYGCFMKNGTKVTGVFADESELDITVRTYYGGEVILIPLAEQECDTAPSASPTNFPTLSPQPTVPRPNLGGKRKVASGFIIMAVFTVMQSDVMW
eukprot:CAMPEP_0172305388 /NCGR_PEP_ID=MMETSP1058-20130122/6691_1 /TAXON_ID=83371 /ORGANISM="Detonula confervacea, Strain CCMP 353" /LENGTH=1217 /DNA_ID=CAMNT_0013016979 /DNA_START=73 /DNA_END=3723 /DNA_ORIENTATION=+